MIILTVKLVLVHLIGDFLLQPSSWVKDKVENKLKAPSLYFHIAVHFFLLLLVFGFDMAYWPVYSVILLSHFVFDAAKIYFTGMYNERLLFIIDQALHFLVIAGVVIYKFPLSISIFDNTVFLTIFTSVLALTYPTAITLKVLLSKWTKELEFKKDELFEKKYQGMSDAGKYIGMLERLFIFFFVLIGQWEGIGFLLTAKSIFRFGDLTSQKDHKLTEYILIGTLLSFGIAVTIGMFCKEILAKLP